MYTNIEDYLNKRLDNGESMDEIMQKISDAANKISANRAKVKLVAPKDNPSFMDKLKEDNLDLNDVIELLTYVLAKKCPQVSFTKQEYEEYKKRVTNLSNHVTNLFINAATGDKKPSTARTKHLDSWDSINKFFQMFDL